MMRTDEFATRMTLVGDGPPLRFLDGAWSELPLYGPGRRLRVTNL